MVRGCYLRPYIHSGTDHYRLILVMLISQRMQKNKCKKYLIAELQRDCKGVQCTPLHRLS